MGSANFNEEEKRSYRKEFLDFLMEKVNHAGGSLQFQYLSGLIQQIRFEVREACGTTKTELMKFLRAHSNIFKIDSKGIVTVVDIPPLEDCGSMELTDNSNNLKLRKNLPSKIENGQGSIIRIHPEFGLILASEPVRAHVYFTPSNYDKSNRESLLIDHHDLHVGTEVYFNAVYGHGDLEIQYRASDVWQKRDENSYPKDSKKDVNKLSHKNASKVHKDVNKNHKDVNKSQKDVNTKNKTAVLDKSNFKDKKNSNQQRKTVEKIMHPEKSYNQPSPHTKANEKDFVKKSKLINQPGKIYPYKNGAVIKFGKDYSEMADGDSCIYYLYGEEVLSADIEYEFSEGRDVYFDAIEIKAHPYWQAVLVWVGEKPIDVERKKVYIKEISENNEDQIYVSVPGASSESYYSSAMNKTVKSKSDHFDTEKKSSISFHDCVNKKDFKSNVKHKDNNLERSKNSFQKVPLNKLRIKKNESKPKRKKNHNNKNNAISQSTTKYTESSSTEDNESLFSSRETILSKKFLKNNHKSYDDDDDEFQSVIRSSKKFLKEHKYECSASRSRFKFKRSSADEVNSSEETSDTKPESPNNNVKGKASIKKYENIEGKITRLLCRAAFVQSPCLQKEIDFVINTFYLNGRSVEDQYVIDLKEVLKIEDIVKFNCFIIIDDLGEASEKITMAWIGKKPENVCEMTPEEFIVEYDLSVSNKLYSTVNSEKDFLSQTKFSLNNESEKGSDGSEYEDAISENEDDISEDIKNVTENEDDISEDVKNITENEYDISEDIKNVTENEDDISENVKNVTENEDDTSENESVISEDKNISNYKNDITDNKKDISEVNDLSEDMLENQAESLKKISENDDLSPNAHYRLLSERLIEELKRKIFTFSDQVDLNTVINEVSIVLRNSSIKDMPLKQEVPSESNFSEILCSECASRAKLLTTENTTDVEAQTIITGEIVATRDKFSVLKRKKKRKNYK